MPPSDPIEGGPQPKRAGAGRRSWALLLRGARATARTYLTIGGSIGGVSAVVAFILAWAFCIANFGTVFGVSMGWIPAVIAAVITGAFLRRLWGPALVFCVLLLTAPAWDRDGRFQRFSARVAANAGSALQWTVRTGREQGKLLEMELRRENLWPVLPD